MTFTLSVKNTDATQTMFQLEADASTKLHFPNQNSQHSKPPSALARISEINLILNMISVLWVINVTQSIQQAISVASQRKAVKKLDFS